MIHGRPFGPVTSRGINRSAIHAAHSQQLSIWRIRMLGFDLDMWDYITFAVLLVIAVGAVAGAVILLGLPGKIALARKHPEAEAVNLMGWAGGLAVVPWIQAFIWAFKPTDVIDIRRFPLETQKAIEEEIQRLKGVEAVEKAIAEKHGVDVGAVPPPPTSATPLASSSPTATERTPESPKSSDSKA